MVSGSRGAHLAECSWKPHMAAGQVTLWYSWPLSGQHWSFLRLAISHWGCVRYPKLAGMCQPVMAMLQHRGPCFTLLLVFSSLYSELWPGKTKNSFQLLLGMLVLGERGAQGLQRLCPWGPQGNTAQLHTLWLRNDDLVLLTEAASDSCLVHLSLHVPSIYMN